MIEINEPLLYHVSQKFTRYFSYSPIDVSILSMESCGERKLS